MPRVSGPGRGALKISYFYRYRKGALGRKDPQFANERAEPREVTGLPGPRRAPPLVAKDSGTQTENTLPWGLLRVTGSFRTHAQQPRAAVCVPLSQKREQRQEWSPGPRRLVGTPLLQPAGQGRTLSHPGHV